MLNYAMRVTSLTDTHLGQVVSLEPIARMYGQKDDGKHLVELSIEGFCYLCRVNE